MGLWTTRNRVISGSFSLFASISPFRFLFPISTSFFFFVFPRLFAAWRRTIYTHTQTLASNGRHNVERERKKKEIIRRKKVEPKHQKNKNKKIAAPEEGGTGGTLHHGLHGPVEGNGPPINLSFCVTTSWPAGADGQQFTLHEPTAGTCPSASSSSFGRRHSLWSID